LEGCGRSQPGAEILDFIQPQLISPSAAFAGDLTGKNPSSPTYFDNLCDFKPYNRKPGFEIAEKIFVEKFGLQGLIGDKPLHWSINFSYGLLIVT
jgi:hypothetical protein